MVMSYGENAVDRMKKKEDREKGDSSGTIRLSHPALDGLKEGDYATIHVCVVKPGKSCTLDVMSVEPEENSADVAMHSMMGDRGEKDSSDHSSMIGGAAGGEEDY